MVRHCGDCIISLEYPNYPIVEDAKWIPAATIYSRHLKLTVVHGGLYKVNVQHHQISLDVDKYRLHDNRLSIKYWTSVTMLSELSPEFVEFLVSSYRDQ